MRQEQFGNGPLHIPPVPHSAFLGPLKSAPPKILACVDPCGEMLTLRAAGPDNHGLCWGYLNDSALSTYQCKVGKKLDPWRGVTPEVLRDLLDHTEDSFNSQPRSPALWQWIVFNERGDPVGFVELSTVRVDEGSQSVSPDALMIGCVIDTAHQGNRYGFQALQRVIDWVKSTNQVTEIQGWCHPRNRPSQGTMEKLGMEKDSYKPKITRYFPMLDKTCDLEVWCKKL